MKLGIKKGRAVSSGAVRAVCAAGLMFAALPAMAALDGRDIIGPHEYDLPVDFKPFNVFVQYADFDSSGRSWNNAGDTVSGPHTETIVGLSKYVHFWAPTSTIGLAYEVVLPEVAVRTVGAYNRPGSSVSGVSDPLTGPAIWYRPVNGKDFNITLGYDFLLQVPIGDSAVGGGDTWHLNSAFLYNINYYNWNVVGDVGTLRALSHSAASGTRPGTHYYADLLLSYHVSSHFEPFIGATYEHIAPTRSRSGPLNSPLGYETLASVGAYMPTFANQSITLRYSKGVDGKNHHDTNELGLKYVVVW